MKNLLRLIISVLFLTTCFSSNAQVFSQLEILIDQPVAAFSTFPITVTSRGECLYPYPQNEQAPDIEVVGNQLEITIYARYFGLNTVPVPPCVNRTQTYFAPVLRPGSYQMTVYIRYLREIFPGFSVRQLQGTFLFQVAEAVPITQIPATSGWSLALLLLGIFGAARWASGVSER